MRILNGGAQIPWLWIQSSSIQTVEEAIEKFQEIGCSTNVLFSIWDLVDTHADGLLNAHGLTLFLATDNSGFLEYGELKAICNFLGLVVSALLSYQRQGPFLIEVVACRYRRPVRKLP
jgi:hypothetical protein